MKLKEIREEKELKQIEVAELLKVSRSVYGMWEQEHDIIPLKRLIKFCDLFHVSVDYVLGFSEDVKYLNMQRDMDIDKLKKRLKELRISKSLTQKELAVKLNITRSLISKYENGINLIITGFLIEYASYFNVSCDYLLGRIDEKVYIKKKIAI